MMHLWLLRHGDALHPQGINDADRSLSPLGRQQVRRIGAFISKRPDMPQRILTSPFTRAMQTASAVASHCGGLEIETTDTLRSGSTSADLLRHLHSRKERSLLLVGHEPLMSAFTSMLSAGHSSSFLRFSPCTLALVQYGGRARPDGGTLEILVPPEALVRARTTQSEKRP